RRQAPRGNREGARGALGTGTAGQGRSGPAADDHRGVRKILSRRCQKHRCAHEAGGRATAGLVIMSSQPSNFHASDRAAYEVWLGRWSRRLATVFLDFVEFPDSGELLDVGCGTGALTFAMADRWSARSVIGVDLAAPFISYARSRRTGDRPTFETGDACAQAS